MKKHVALYLRVSSKSQDTRSQEPDVARWAEAQSEPTQVYKDQFSGKTMSRPGWDKLMADVHAGLVTKIVVWRLDRIGRTAKGLTALFAELVERKVGLVSLKDHLDLSTPAGKLMAHVLASVAEYETEIRRERILAGQKVARERDKKTWGGSKPGKLLGVTPEQVQVVSRMLGERAKKAAISRATGLSRPTIYRLIERGHVAQPA